MGQAVGGEGVASVGGMGGVVALDPGQPMGAQGRHERLLVAEQAVERLYRAARPLGHAAHGDGLVALLPHDGQGRIEKVLPRELLLHRASD